MRRATLHYLEALRFLHSELSPSSYVEIGCRKGKSLALAQCPSIAIDPDFSVCEPLHFPTRIFKETSDYFFAHRDLRVLIGGPFDMALIDGMHLSEYVLRDFVNLEKFSHADSVIVIDDVLPAQMEWTSRDRRTKAWTGDVYKVIPLLRRERPDLSIKVFDIATKGMAVVRKLSSDNSVLEQKLGQLEAYLKSGQSDLQSADAIRTSLKPAPPEHLRESITHSMP